MKGGLGSGGLKQNYRTRQRRLSLGKVPTAKKVRIEKAL